MSRSRLLRLLSGAALVAALMLVPTSQASRAGGGCHSAARSGEGVASGAAIVVLQECAFQPAVLRVSAGAEVTFVNRDVVHHAVTGSGWGDAESLDRDESVSHRFDRPGIYAYQCYLHPGMVGAIVVDDQPVLGKMAQSTDALPPAADSRAGLPAETSVNTSAPVLIALAGLPAALTFAAGLSIGWLRGRRSAG